MIPNLRRLLVRVPEQHAHQVTGRFGSYYHRFLISDEALVAAHSPSALVAEVQRIIAAALTEAVGCEDLPITVDEVEWLP